MPRVSSEVANDSPTIEEALAPPASDADKWFITVVTMQGCAGCERLKRDWVTNEWLLALANPADPKSSWSHYNAYSREDKSQAWRFEKLRITAYPTVLVQPPRTGRFGNPATIVYQGTYGGNPQRLAEEITRAIKLYVKKLAEKRPVNATGDCGPDGCDLPWNPPPKEDPLLPQLRPNREPLFKIPPDSLFERPLQKLIDAALGFLVSGLVVVGLIVGVIYAVRTYQTNKARQAELTATIAALQKPRRRKTPRRKPPVKADA